MVRLLAIALLFISFCCVSVCAAATEDWMGVGINLSMVKPSGGDRDYEEAGLAVGIQIKKPLSERLSVACDYSYGRTGSSADLTSPGVAGIQGWGDCDDFLTTWNHIDLSANLALSRGGRVKPFVSAGMGLTFWGVQDWRDEAAEKGRTPDGYDADGKLRKLRGTNLTAVLGAGVEFFATDNMSVTLSGRYRHMLEADRDNVGASAALGPDHVDANAGALEGCVALTYYFGPTDCDGDGVFDHLDRCRREMEDLDGFEDHDGCPDPDNDADGILDLYDACPDEAEDFDGFQDEDGCPDIDTDGDGIMDMDDACPDDAEDIDGFQDEDGCPDPDNDGDGVPDTMDRCPQTPRGVSVDDRGCVSEAPKPVKPEGPLVLEGVTFAFDSVELTAEARAKLDKAAGILHARPEVTLEVSGHTCDIGTEAHNQELSEARAAAVKSYLVLKGIAEDRIACVGYGESRPAFPNTSRESRARNRRAVFPDGKK